MENLTFKVCWNTRLSHLIASYIEAFHFFMIPKSVSLSQAHNCVPRGKRLQFFNEDITLYSSYRKWERGIVIRASRLGLYCKLKNLECQ